MWHEVGLSTPEEEAKRARARVGRERGDAFRAVGSLRGGGVLMTSLSRRVFTSVRLNASMPTAGKGNKSPPHDVS